MAEETKRYRKELLYSREDIRQRVLDLGSRISADHQGDEPVLIGILNGVVFFFADLARAISLHAQMDFIRVASYGSQMVSSGALRLTKDVEIPLKGRKVIVVEDIVDTGRTVAHVLKRIEDLKPRSVQLCALIDKRERREAPVSIDYSGFRIDEGFIVGYGLDFKERYRCLPELYVLR